MVNDVWYIEPQTCGKGHMFTNSLKTGKRLTFEVNNTVVKTGLFSALPVCMRTYIQAFKREHTISRLKGVVFDHKVARTNLLWKNSRDVAVLIKIDLTLHYFFCHGQFLGRKISRIADKTQSSTKEVHPSRQQTNRGAGWRTEWR